MNFFTMSRPTKDDLIKLRNEKNKQQNIDLMKIKESYQSFGQFLNKLDINDQKQYDINKLLTDSDFYNKIHKCINNGNNICTIFNDTDSMSSGINIQNMHANNLINIGKKYINNPKFENYLKYFGENIDNYNKTNPDINLSQEHYKNICKNFSDFLNFTYGNKFSTFELTKYSTCIIYCNINKMK